MEHHTLPEVKSFILTPDHLGGIEFGLQLLWSAQTFDSPYQLWRATSSFNRCIRVGRGAGGALGGRSEMFTDSFRSLGNRAFLQGLDFFYLVKFIGVTLINKIL